MLNRLTISTNTIALKKALLSFLLVIAVVNLSACTTYHGTAKILSSPSGAQVINRETGEILGHTPVTVHWKDTSGKRQTIILNLEKPGFYPKTASFWLEMRSLNAKDALENRQLVEVEMQKIGE